MTGFPPLNVLLGAAGSGKTERAVQFAGSAASGLIIVPTHNQAVFLTSHSNLPSSVKCLALQRFVEKHLPPGMSIVGAPLQQMIMRELIGLHLHSDGYFGKVLDKPGLVGVLLDGIRLMKLTGVSPTLLAEAAQAASKDAADTSQKLREFAVVFQQYVLLLSQQLLLDDADLISAAIDAVRSKAPAEAIVFDGFTRLHPLHIQLVAALASHPRSRVMVTLCADESRALWFARPIRLLESLRNTFLCTEELLPAANTGITSLDVVRNHLGSTVPNIEPQRNGPPIQLINAPNQVIEVEMLARTIIEVRRRLNCEWKSIAVVLRSPGPYLPLLKMTFARFGIPAALPVTEPISQNPRIATVLSLLRMAINDWRSEDVVSVIQSAYTGITAADALVVTRHLRRSGDRNGMSNWMRWTEEPDFPKGIADLFRSIQSSVMSETNVVLNLHEAKEFIKRLLADFCSHEVKWLDTDEDVELRDSSAQNAALSSLDDIAATCAMLGRETLSIRDLYTRLEVAWRLRDYVSLQEGNRVQAVDPYSTREVAIRAAFVPGLVERLFPQRVIEDPLFRDDERVLLRSIAPAFQLEPELDRVDEERFMFYLAATSASDQIVLTYPRAGADRDTLPSFYLHDLRQALLPATNADPLMEEIRRKLWDVAPRIEDAVDKKDLLRAALAAYWHPAAEQGPAAEEVERGRRILERLANEDDTMEAVTEVMASRELPPPNTLQGIPVQNGTARNHRVYSLTELQTFAICPFQYYMRFTLQIDQREDVNEYRMQSIMLHGALFRFYHGGGQRPLEQIDQLKAALDAEISSWVPPVPKHRLPLLREYLRDLLMAFAERDEFYSERWHLHTAYVELAFGVPLGQATPDVEYGQHEHRTRHYDRKSSTKPLIIADPTGGAPVHVCGVIDRVDVNERGDIGLAIDYKLNRSPDLAGLEQALDEGSSLQMPVYMLALERVFNIEPLGACYDIMRQKGRPRLFRIPSREHNLGMLPQDDNRHVRPISRDQWNTMTEKLEGTIVRLARGIESADITAKPGSHCSYCPYGAVCRTTADYGYDGGTAKEGF